MSEPIGRVLKRPVMQNAEFRKLVSTPDILAEFGQILALHAERVRMREQPATPTMVFFHDQDRLKCCLNDRGASRSLFTTCDTWQQAYEQLNRKLLEASPDWRPYKPWGKRPY